MRYIDGFVLPLSKDRLAQYIAIAKSASEIWKEHGALEYWECVGDDLDTECTRTFTDMANARSGVIGQVTWLWHHVTTRSEANSMHSESIVVTNPMRVSNFNAEIPRS